MTPEEIDADFTRILASLPEAPPWIANAPDVEEPLSTNDDRMTQADLDRAADYRASKEMW